MLPPPLNMTVVTRPDDPLDLPIQLSLARQHLVLGDETDRDELIKELIRDARDWVEDVARICLVPTTIDQRFQSFPCSRWGGLELGRYPLTSVTEVVYTNTAGNEITMPSTDYQVQGSLNPPTIFLKQDKSWPTDIANQQWPVRVRFQAGANAALRGPFRHAILLLLTFFHENPGAMNKSGRELKIPDAVMNVLSPAIKKGYP